jgi:Flp pilus assembly protein TadG
MLNSSRRLAHPRCVRSGKVLVLFAVVLPALLAIAGLVLDGGGLLNESRKAQHAADAAATAAARSLQDGQSAWEAVQVAEEYVHEFNNLPDATVAVSLPPTTGPYAGDADAVEVEVFQPTQSHFLKFLGRRTSPTVRSRAVARYEPATAGAALVVLDPDPSPLGIPAIGGLLPALPTLLAGFEIIGTSRVRVDGAVLVNTTWGGFDENGDRAGERPGPPYALLAPGLLSSQTLQARDIRVVGGVDHPDNYGHFVGGESSPLRANRLPVPDPLIDLPTPTTVADPTRVSGTLRGGVRIADLPLLSPPRTLSPGVYDYLQIVSGTVTFTPGVYIIRSVDPLTQIALNITGGRITANGVMFYITNSPGYTPGAGLPDAGDGDTPPPTPGVTTLLPSTVIVGAVLANASTFRGINAPGSPYDGVLIFQRRQDRRPIVLMNDVLLGGDDFHGVIYAKWGHVILSGSGFEQTRVVSGTLRMITILPSTIAPDTLLPPARDVFLVE